MSITSHGRPQPHYAARYAADVLAAVELRTGPLTAGEHDQLYGALYAAAATGAGDVPDPQRTNVAALAELVSTSRNGPCRRCASPLADHTLDLVAYPWLTCPAHQPSDRRRRAAAWAIWVAVPLLSLGILAPVPSFVAALKHPGRGWGIATAVLMVLTLSLWTQPDVDLATQLSLWLGAGIYGASQIPAWLRLPARAGAARPRGPSV